MDREELRQLINRHLTFALSFSEHKGDIEATVEHLESQPDDWSFFSGEAIGICRELHSLGIDPTPIWDFNFLANFDGMQSGGSLEGGDLRELRRAVHRFFLPVMLFDKDFKPPSSLKMTPSSSTMQVIELIQKDLPNETINERTGKSATNIATIRSRYEKGEYDLESSHD